MNTAVNVSIIIPFFNHIDTTKACLESIYENTPYNEIRYEIVLVDDCSSEKIFLEKEKTQFPYCKVVKNEVNQGFAKSCNLGAANATSKYLVFLNNDTIALKGWLEGLFSIYDSESRVGIVGSKLLYGDNTIQHAGVCFDDEGMPFHMYHRFPSTFAGANKVREFQAVTGACFSIEASLFKELGGFNEQYLNGLEDIDLCFRVMEKGFRILYNPKSCLYHLESQTRTLDPSKNQKNIFLFHQFWKEKISADYRNYYQADLTDANLLPEQLIKVKELFGKGNTTLAIWGAGRGGRHAAALLRYIGINPDVFIDSDPNKWGVKIDNCEIQRPEYLKEIKNSGRNVFIIIASLWFKEIEKEMINLGLEPGKEFFKDTIFAK